MPHYLDGTPAKNGDLVVFTESHDGGSEKAGVLMSITPGSDTCNGTLQLVAQRQKGTDHWTPISSLGQYCTLKECRKV